MPTFNTTRASNFAFLLVCGYADGSETYVPLDYDSQPLTPALTEIGLALWLLLVFLRQTNRNRWNEIGTLIPSRVKALVYEYRSLLGPPGAQLFWAIAARRARQRAACFNY